MTTLQNLSAQHQAEPKEEALIWRLPPEQSLADWELDIVSEDDGTSTVYHVHTSTLAVLPRKCRYFGPIFGDGGAAYKEKRTRTSRILLPKLAADAFPCLLDYVYGANLEDTVDVETIGAAVFLADRFDCPKLATESKKRWIRLRTTENIHIFYKHATGLLKGIEIYLNDVAKFSTDNLDRFTPASKILSDADADFWLGAIRMRFNGEEKTVGDIRLIPTICELHTDMPPTVFEQLTDKKFLPTPSLNASVAVRMLHLEADIVGGKGDKGSELPASALQERCFSVLVDTGDEETISSLLSKYRYKQEVVAKLLSNAVKELKSSKANLKRLKASLNTIVVHGAGFDGINGTYYIEGLNGGALKFVKRHENENGEPPSLSTIVRAAGNETWFISYKGSHTQDKLPIYNAHASEHSQLPPEIGWSSYNIHMNAWEPPPKMRISSNLR